MSKNIFENMAHMYDTPERKQLAQIITNKIKPEFYGKVIDYGCGTGLVSLPLANQAEHLLLIDPAENMLALAQQKINQQQLTNVHVLPADFTEEVPEVTADLIMMSLVLLHIPDTKKILTELFKLLPDKGKLLIVDFAKNPLINHPKVHNGFSATELTDLLETIGFSQVTIQNFYHGEKIFMNQDAGLFLATCIK
ncbi:class I SAM-dependent methyltransferase [Enterococcus dongliensis]|uniref:class I SAM-dependent methyltransferase n=1 Tax=Enterococcus dongliensis TaxID=2559925 RepID=UPI00288D6967|nr:class I SAM-dependent methyltransferase [Enterococcus dongliensis]MDT2634737.1 class I SAM-dependent methyltransferase [Enterococcus dongliensis]MDT2669281.1 class I SAM-dependent methyltransferase [Enterococcus dongliensis]MDT2677024.1 class I SAM-dependent methyltransferase [Enterococcus dongliensis]